MRSRYDARVSNIRRWTAVAIIATVSLAGCSKEELSSAADDAKSKAGDVAKAAAARVAKESYCIRWRALKEGVKLKDNRTVMDTVGKAGDELKSKVPDDQRKQLDTALSAAGEARDQWDKLDPKAKGAIEAKFNEAAASIDSYCEGTLASLGDGDKAPASSAS